MGNAVPRMCHDTTATTAAQRRSGNAGASAAAAQPVPVATASSCQGGKVVPRRRAVEEQRAGGGGAVGSVVMTVKVVMTRKEAEKLVARLEEQNARERKARMAELTGRLRRGDSGAGGGRSPEAWTPGLAPIQEN